MAGVTRHIPGSFKGALSVPVSISATLTAPSTITTNAITRAEMESVLATADRETIVALSEILRVMEGVRLGMQIGTEEELEESNA